LAAPALVLAFLLSGCEAFDASLLEDSGRGPGCDVRRPPARSTAEGDDGSTRLYAIRAVRLNQAMDVWRTTGYDLDGLCSEEPELRVECDAPSGVAPPALDGEGGTDNSLGGNLLPVILAVRDDFYDRAESGQSQGLGAIMIQIEGWNGEANDDRVEATFMQTVFGSGVRLMEPLGELDVSEMMLRIDGEAQVLPAWEGDDWFYARNDGFLEGDINRPRSVDDNAYVTDDTLVMRLPDRFPFYLGGDETGVNVALTDVVFTVRLTADHVRVEEAILAGRWSSLDILSGVESTGICPGSEDYDALSRLLDVAVDIRSVPESGGPGVACDAISVGLAFDDGVLANLAGVHPGFPLPDPCAVVVMDGGVDAGDAGIDGGTDAATDAAPDAASDATMDAASPDAA